MKTQGNYRRMGTLVLALALAQLGCSFGTLAPSTAPIPTIAPAATLAPTSAPAPTSAAATSAPAGTASKFGTPDEAQAMLKKAVEHYNAVGRAKALADFTGRVAPFFHLDLYVACIDSNLRQSANGGFPNLVGSAVEPINRAAWDAATTTKIGTVNYSWIDPETGSSLPKTFYYEKVGSDVCGVGAYHP